MSDYSGPGTYEIVPFLTQTKSLNVWEGNTDAGTPIRLYQRISGDANSQFEIVAAGGTNSNPESGDREYHIIAVNSGLYMAWTDNGTVGQQEVTTELRRPKDRSVRWKLMPVGNGSYYIMSIDGRSALNVRGGSKEDGAEIILYRVAVGASIHSHFLLKLPSSDSTAQWTSRL